MNLIGVKRRVSDGGIVHSAFWPASVFSYQCSIILVLMATDYARALVGVKTVFCTMPHMQGWTDAFPAFLKECKVMKEIERGKR